MRKINAGIRIHSLIALDGVAELRTIRTRGGELWIGSCVTHADGSSHPLIRSVVPGFAHAWQKIANVRVRYRATIGGNLMALRRRYEMSVLLTALKAKLVFLDRDSEFSATPSDLWSGAAPERALLTHIVLPISDHFGFFYDRTLRPSVTLALGLTRTGCRVEGCAALATEHKEPARLEFQTEMSEIANNAQLVADRAFRGLSDAFADRMTSNWYLRKAGQTLLARQLQQVRMLEAQTVVDLNFRLNGTPRNAQIPASLTLIELLRDRCGLKGTKLACSAAVCGSCTVLIDRKPAASCAVFAFQVDGADVQTIEGLRGDAGDLHPIQQAFIDHSAFQCGYCTSGMIMLAKALLDHEPDPRSGTNRGLDQLKHLPLHWLHAHRGGHPRRCKTP